MPERKAAAERMSRVDTAWLRMDNESNLMMIVGVWLLAPPLDHARLVERVRERMLGFRRFRQKVVKDALGALWVDDERFDIGRHVVRETLPRGRSRRAALQARVARLATTPLDHRHPLWQFHLVEDYESGRSALIARIHHCIADGIALIAVIMSLVDGGAPPPPGREAPPDGVPDDVLDAIARPFAELTGTALGLASEGLAKSVGLLATQPLGMARAGMQLVGDAAALLLMPDDSPTRLKGRPGRAKRVAWSKPLPLDEVKAVGKALGCSVNDVLLASVAGAIGGWLAEQGDDTAGKEIRAMVPVNLRPPESAPQLGNRFGLAPLILPIGIANPVERVYEVRARMSALKGSYQPLLAFAVLAVAGLLVKPAQDALLGLFARKTTAVVTNLPGPGTPVRLCGSTLEQVMFWVPQSGDIGVGVSILSYAGAVQFGLITAEKLCPEPQAIIERFRPEFDRLLLLTLMLPWERPAG
ncbi:MAG TPA: wax ester/triacylglycerol synthase family O-acyltransferase [Ideonella sp.]|nr:wax ester/triacylglycerol synthase family O-acyltransferase [Ideonella sp.]